MANTTFTDLPTGSALTGAEIMGGDQGATTIQFTSGAVAALAGVTPPAQYGNYVVQGGGVNWLGTGFQFSISAATYVIAGTTYTSAQTNLTNSASDPSNPRIDVWALTTSGTAIIIAGTAAASPVKPAVDPTTQIEIGFILIAAGSTTANVTNLDLYLNNAEWTAAAIGGTVNVDSTSNPFAGTKDIEFTASGAGAGFTLTNGSPVSIGQYSNLTLQIRSKAAWANAKRLQFQWRSGTALVGAAVQIAPTGTFGFSSSTTGSYQSVSIPISNFAVGNATVTNLLCTVTGGGGTIGLYVDNVIAQAGVQTVSDTTGEDMTFKGAYSAAASYNAQDTVTSSGVTYVAIQPVPPGQTPASSPTYWTAITTGASSAVDVQTFTSGTSNWTKPSGAKSVRVILIGGGGGGGGGARRSGGNTPGGSGGGGGLILDRTFDPASLTSTVSVTVGAGGAGGAGAGGDPGNSGSAGTPSTFGAYLTAYAGGAGGRAGAVAYPSGSGAGILSNGNASTNIGIAAVAGTLGGGIGATSSGTAGVTNTTVGGAGGGNGSSAGTTGGVGGGAVVSAPGGGGGGGTDGFSTNGSGGAGAVNFNATPSTGGVAPSGNAGTAPAAIAYTDSSSGGGGAGGNASPGGNGANGVRGGGGGGGGTASNATGGNGGNGGDGYCVVISWL